MFRFRFWKLAVLGWSLTQPRCLTAAPPSSQEPGRLALPTEAVSPNQQMADRIVQRLNESGRLRGYAINVSFLNGVVGLSGTVADQPQHDEALRLVQGMPGVVSVRDLLNVGTTVTQIRAADPPPKNMLPAPLPGAAPPDLPPVPPAQPLPPVEGAPFAPPGGNAPLPEPVPIFQAPSPSPYDLNPPKMPPYAWPTYAPYNNLSRVAYPNAYPYEAWPFIGPIYPFPKIPLSWRSVKLEWDDGHWWYKTNCTPYDWWRVRYW